VCIALVPLFAYAAEPGPAAYCAEVRNDDAVRAYDPSLRPGLLNAYARLFPQARMPPDDRVFQASTHLRCADGRLLACFTGANLPCGKLNAARDNRGAAAFCAENPNAQVVPAFATGHDAAFLYRCAAGQAEMSGETFVLDRRGFAAELWAPLD
jgi:hypothetical protein